MCARGELESSCLGDMQNLRDVPYRPRLVCRPMEPGTADVLRRLEAALGEAVQDGHPHEALE